MNENNVVNSSCLTPQQDKKMKKKYQTPQIGITKIVTARMIAGSQGDISSVGFDSTGSISSEEEFGSRRAGSFWDDDDE